MVTHAPAFFAQPLAGGSPVTLTELLRDGPVVVVFFKVSCPTCQLAFPFLERLHVTGTGLRLVGVSQDERKPTAQFAERFGVTFPILLDLAAEGYRASNAYGLTHVPAVFAIEPDGTISHSWTGFSRADIEKLALGAGAVVFRPQEDVPAWKAG